jgi:tetratricopeptide (TPR) repeat protein
LSKRKRKKRRKSRPSQALRWHRQPPSELQRVFRQADSLIDRGRAREAIALLEPLLPSYPRVADLHYYVGYAHVKAGDIWGGLAGYERAIKLSRDPGYWLPFASFYLELELRAHALHAFRQVLERPADISMIDNVREAIVALEKDVRETADNLGLPMAQVEKGLRHLEDGQRALRENDFPTCIAASRRAIKLLADWPPPRNNLSLALFFVGQPEKAIATARQVLSGAPDNVQALSNAIRFLAWTGQETEARALWARLKEITPQEDSERLKVAEAAAILNEDESVYQLLKSLEKSGAARGGVPGFSWQTQLFLAVAEANTGRRAARRRLRALQDEVPWAGNLLAALKARQPGPGWAERFPYFHSSELLPIRRIEEFVELVGHQDEMSPQRFRGQVMHFVARFPQVVLMAEKMIWEDAEPDAGVAILATVATPAAHVALRRFGLSQAGEDEARMQALISLMQAGEIAQDETLRVWSGGEWREVHLRLHEISDEPETLYTPEVADLLNQGMLAFQQDDQEQAERLFRRALALDPRAKEAYNNLGVIYGRRGEHERAKEMYRAVLEIDPTYAFPRCNLATYLLDEDDVEGAQAMLAPLDDVTRLRPQEMAFYSYAQARILMHREEYEAARRTLQVALEVYPDYGPAADLLDHLERVIPLLSGFESLMERQHKRDQARRARMQTKLSTAKPSLSEALSIYTKGALTGVGRVVLPWGGWSGLRKAELLQRIVEGLQDLDNLERIVADLYDKERAALRQVLAVGGVMPWGDFDAEYGNDMEESLHWEYHEPETVMGCLRLRGLLAEATVDGELLVTVPSELRPVLREMLD